MVNIPLRKGRSGYSKLGIGPNLFDSILKYIPFILSLITLSISLFDFGFDQSPEQNLYLRNCYFILFSLEIIIILLRYIPANRPRKSVFVYDIILLMSLILTISVAADWIYSSWLDSSFWISFVIVLIFFRELTPLNINYRRKLLNPAQLFMISFLFLIFGGTFLLMLPHATYDGISFIDALFTSTSAVCVTGLAVVDTGTYFTLFGQTAIMVLIQLGGLGIMTFTSYFSYFFTGQASYENQLLIQEMTNSEKITEVFSTLKRILFITFLIEGIGAILIFFSIDKSVAESLSQRIYFSVFHAVSGFCNAGFSTLTNNLWESSVRFNYPLQLIISGLLILGGIGFPIIFNFTKYLRHLLQNRVFRKESVHAPRVISMNTRIVLVMTVFLLVAGTAIFYFLECNNTLAEHKGIGKVITAFFCASTPRTAGFSAIDYTILQTPAVILMYFLMWVGASPGGTGGGIKTSTFAICILNSISIARGKDRIDFRGREISGTAVRRAYSQVFLSFLAIGISVFAIVIFQDDISLKAVIFEVISAFSTVGLSLGVTAKFCAASKLVLVLTMFVGRVSMLTVLVSFFKQAKLLNYRFPSEDILIN